MVTSISESVGRAGRNLPDDVRVIQRLLAQRGYRVGAADGLCGSRTQYAIDSFQHSFLKNPDGRIDPGGATLKRLQLPVHSAQARSPALNQLLPKPARDSVNIGLTAVGNDYMLKVLGAPRSGYSQDCQPIENARLKRQVQIGSVGPFRVQGLTPAVLSLQRVLVDVNKRWPDVYAALGTAGMLCCRFQRGSSTKISNHSWGTAIDLTINGVLDKRGDNKVQAGLSMIAPIFNSHGWYWGATFPTEDAMHFEAGKELIDQWASSLLP